MRRKRDGAGFHSWRIVLVMAVLFIGSPAVVSAQQDASAAFLQDARVSNFRFAEPGELTITVSLLGAVRAPGRYEISRSVDLMDLLALAGGWTEQADLKDVRVSPAKVAGEKQERMEIRLDLEDFGKVIPTFLTLRHGDLIYVGTQSTVTIERILAWVGTAATLATLYITIQNYSN